MEQARAKLGGEKAPETAPERSEPTAVKKQFNQELEAEMEAMSHHSSDSEIPDSHKERDLY